MARPRSALRRYQDFTVDLIKSVFGLGPLPKIPGLVLAYDMGAGKTGSVLTALVDLYAGEHIKKTLVVAPLLVAQTTWPDEIEEWEHTQALTWTLLRPDDDDPDVLAAGEVAYAEVHARLTAEFEAARQENLDLGMNKGAARAQARKVLGRAASDLADDARVAAVAEAKDRKRAQLAAEPTQIHIINKENLPWLFQHFGEARWPYDVVVWDEPTKSGKKKTKKGRKDDPLSRFGILSRVRKHLKGVIQLTGTPTPKGLINLWALAYLVDFGERLGTTKTAFERRWFNVNQYNVVRKITPKDHAFAEITGLVKDIMFSLDPKDLAELPPIVIDPVKVRLPAKALEQYRQFKRHMVSEELDVEAVSRGVLHNKLLQFANGSMYQESGEDIPIHDAKIEALERIVEQIDGRPLLVAYTYKFDVDRILKRFPNAVELKDSNPRDTVKRWNAGKIDMLLVHRASAGHGLNLQFGSNHMCEYGLTADLELYLQFLKRLQRPGQQSTVFNHVIFAEGTIDEEIFPSYIDPKNATQEAVLKAIRLTLPEQSRLEPSQLLIQLLVVALAA